ncbi:hypothetical protein [Paenibacillus contaminans]|uniref:Uncharacterized protein n=1 Tax=Paenibacillus contaminans TaxID=450362 RepID=A0A329LU00_9BACL|nr:hypothetical protein [Paenibacillus contaminans]RAV11465.1 hypothetical protein DQG23_36065 [Paenibacillus contaminans]
MTPFEFAEQITSKYQTAQRRKAVLPNLIFLKPPSFRWQHVSPSRRREIAPVPIPSWNWNLGLHLHVNHHNHRLEQRTFSPFAINRTTSSFATTFLQPLWKVNNAFHSGTAIGAIQRSSSDISLHDEFARKKREFHSFHHHDHPSMHRTILQASRISSNRFSQSHVRTLARFQSDWRTNQFNFDSATTANRYSRSRTNASYSFNYSKPVSLELAKPQTERDDRPPFMQPERRSEAEASPAPQPTMQSTTPLIDMKRLSDEVYQAIERKLKLERQRKGY